MTPPTDRFVEFAYGGRWWKGAYLPEGTWWAMEWIRPGLCRVSFEAAPRWREIPK